MRQFLLQDELHDACFDDTCVLASVLRFTSTRINNHIFLKFQKAGSRGAYVSTREGTIMENLEVEARHVPVPHAIRIWNTKKSTLRPRLSLVADKVCFLIS